MKHCLKLVAMVVAASALTACASMHSGTTQEVKITSNPVGAAVYVGTTSKNGNVTTVINKVNVGVTPLTVRVSRKDGAVELQKEGYTTVLVPLHTKMNPWVWGDILLTSPLSTSIDTSTGAANEFDPGEYMIDMTPATK